MTLAKAVFTGVASLYHIIDECQEMRDAKTGNPDVIVRESLVKAHGGDYKVTFPSRLSMAGHSLQLDTLSGQIFEKMDGALGKEPNGEALRNQTEF